MDFDLLHEHIQALKSKHGLTNFNFDTECIYDLGDLSTLLTNIVKKTLPGFQIDVTENYTADKKQYVATLSCYGTEMNVYADTSSDWLPDTFFMELEDIPRVFNTGLVYYLINPAIGITGQDAWYFCGTETNLKAARGDGLPLIFPGEHPLDTEEFKLFNGGLEPYG